MAKATIATLSERSACGVQCSGFPAPALSAASRVPLATNFMPLDQRGAGAENHRKCQEEAAN